MADSEDDILLKLDLDDSSFTDSLNTAKETLSAFGSGDSVKGLASELSSMQGTIGEMASGDAGVATLLSGFAELGPMIGLAAGAVGIFVGSLHTVMEGEQLQAVNKEFDLLAANAGIAGDQMKEALIKAAGGMITDTEALQLANGAMLKLGASSAQLPDLMELARKSALVMGTDVETAFNNITMAVASGNQRMLRRVGLQVDVKKAEDEYAQSLGISANELTQVGKSQAVLNAMLEKGATQFAGIDSSLKPTTSAWTQFTVAVKETYELFQKLFATNFGGFFESILKGATSVVNFVKAHVVPGLFMIQKETDAAKKSVEDLKKTTDAANKAGGPSDRVKLESIDNAAVLKQRATFLKELDALKKQYASTDAKLVQSDEQLARSDAQTKLAMTQKLNSDRLEVEQKYRGHKSQIAQLEAQLEKNYDAQIEEFDAQSLDRRKKALDNYLAHAKGGWDGFAREAQVASKKAQMDMEDTATLGKSAFDDLSAGVGDAFQEMGKGAAGGSANIEHAILGMIGKVAGKYGETMMLASLFPFNPAVFAAGAALEVIAGALGQAGSSTSAATAVSNSASTASTGVPGSTSPALLSSSATPSIASQQATQTPQVSINVQGSVFDSPATGMRMVDLIRQASDQTGYNYVQIGNTPYGT